MNSRILVLYNGKLMINIKRRRKMKYLFDLDFDLVFFNFN